MEERAGLTPDLLPAAWQARFHAPVPVRWSDRLPDDVHGRARSGAIAPAERGEADRTFRWSVERYRKIAGEAPAGS